MMINTQKICTPLYLKLCKYTLLQNHGWRCYHRLFSAPCPAIINKTFIRHYQPRRRNKFDFAEGYKRLNDSFLSDDDFQKRPQVRSVNRSAGYVDESLWLRGSAQNNNYQTDILKSSGGTTHSSEKKASWTKLFDAPVKLGGIIHKHGYTPNLPDKLSDIPNLDPRLQKTLRDYGWELPSAIQRYALPILLDGHDIIGAAQTGSGKTLAFLLPLLQSIITTYPEKAMNALRTSNYSVQYPLGLILAPTQELAQQIHLEACKLSRYTCASPVAFFGGQNINVQINALNTSGCHIAVATPGRFKDILDRGYLSLEYCRYLVLDEADRMLDMGFEPQIRAILENPAYKCPGITERQSCMFSATFSDEIRHLALDHVNREKTVMVVVGEDGPMAKNIKLEFDYGRDSREQMDLFVKFMQKIRDKRVLVFCNMKRTVDTVDNLLYKKGIQSVSIHGDKSRNMRDRAMALFKSNRANVLVATDVASRGLDIPNVDYVVMFGLPLDITDFIHRSGRTGRMGSEGNCIAFCNYQDVNTQKIKSLISMLKSMNIEIPEKLRELLC